MQNLYDTYIFILMYIFTQTKKLLRSSFFIPSIVSFKLSYEHSVAGEGVVHLWYTLTKNNLTKANEKEKYEN